jgi:PAS domain S-box-containing protein
LGCFAIPAIAVLLGLWEFVFENAGTLAFQARETGETSTEKWETVVSGTVVAVVAWVLACALASRVLSKTAREMRRLQTTERLLASVVENSPSAISLKDRDGNFRIVNPRFEEWFQIPDAQSLGKTAFDICPDHLARARAELDRRVLETGETCDAEFEVPTPDGGARTLLTMKFPVDDLDGETIGVGTVETDVSAHQQAEAALRESQVDLRVRIEQLEEAQRMLKRQSAELGAMAKELELARDEAEAGSRAKSEFLAAMSHELRTPLNAVIGFSEIIQAQTFGPVGSPQYRDYADDIHGAGVHLLGVINDILDLSRVECGSHELNEETLDLQELLDSAFGLVRPRVVEGGIKLDLEVWEPLPALEADARKLKQVLVNLLTNAVKFTESGGVVTVRVWHREDSGIVVQIADTGIGMAAGDIPKALARFGQVDSRLERRHEGTGLGLPLAKALIELHGGSLDLQSRPGLGTTVTLRLPASRAVAHGGHGELVAAQAS